MDLSGKKDDLTAIYFILGWDSWVDCHGQGIRVFLPNEVKNFHLLVPKEV